MSATYFDSVSEGHRVLSAAFRNRKCLIVIDGCVSADMLRWLAVVDADAGSRIVVTTCETAVLSAIKPACVVELLPFTEQEALAVAANFSQQVCCAERAFKFVLLSY